MYEIKTIVYKIKAKRPDGREFLIKGFFTTDEQTFVDRKTAEKQARMLEAYGAGTTYTVVEG